MQVRAASSKMMPSNEGEVAGTLCRAMELEAWLAQQARASAGFMERSISASGLRIRREHFQQEVVPAKGSVLASPEIAAWDPNPDYFFHWIRDSAIVMKAVLVLAESASACWYRHLDDFVAFSSKLRKVDGAGYVHKDCAPDCAQFLRPIAEIRSLNKDSLLGEPRFNPDGTIDIFRWSRPQNDGPALRALTCMAYRKVANQSRWPAIDRLVRTDLDFTAAHSGQPCIGLWEEEHEMGHHYHTAVVQLGALHHGQQWAGVHDDSRRSTIYRQAAQRLRVGLGSHWSAHNRCYQAMPKQHAAGAEVGLDASAILAVLDAELPSGEHSVLDDKAHSTVVQIEDLFESRFEINHNRPFGHGPALGRSGDDRYFGGGAWYPTTLALAEFYYRLAIAIGRSKVVPETPLNQRFRERVFGGATHQQQRVRACIQRGDGVLATVRRFTPRDGALSEQFDRTTGAQTSARHLSWSYAAFITAAQARRKAMKIP